MRQLCVCQPTRNPSTTRPAAIHARVLRGTTNQPCRLIVKRVPCAAMGFAGTPCADVKVPCSVSVAYLGQSVRISPQQQPGESSGQNVVVLQCRPHLARRGVHVPDAAERMGIIPAGPVVQDAGNAAAALELPQPGSRAGRARRTAHQLPAMDQARLLQPDGDEHNPCLRAAHLLRQSTQRAVDSLQRVIHTTLPPLKTLAKFPPHRATATAPASASSVAIICPPCGLISTMCAAAANETPAAIAAIRLTSGLLVSVVRYETR